MGHRTVANKNNTSGALGVNWSKEKGMWHAKIGFNYKRVHLGYFYDLSDAEMAYLEAKKNITKGKLK